MNNRVDTYCKVCGYDLQFFPWGKDGKNPSFDICDCCGVEFGNEDIDEKSIVEYRKEWISKGKQWFDNKKEPDNWNFERQMKNIS
ncbi:MAG: hypothetical protein ACK5HU_02710 [Flavobacteriales bacterium]